MSNESPRQRKASQLREDRDRCQRAAQRLRYRISQGRYAGLPATDGDDLYAVAAVLDSAGMQLSELPAQTRRDVMHLVARMLDDAPAKPVEVDSLTDSRGEGH